MAKVWTTNTGEKLKLSEMTTSHIINCIATLERFIASRPDEGAYGEPDIDSDAYMEFQSEVRANDRLQEEAEEQIKAFELELERRSDD